MFLYETGFLIVAFLTLSAYLLCLRFLGDKSWVNKKVFFVIGICLGIASLGVWWAVLTLQGKQQILSYQWMLRVSAQALLITSVFYFLSGYLKSAKAKKRLTLGAWIVLAFLNFYVPLDFVKAYRELSASRSCSEPPRAARGQYVLFGLNPDACRRDYSQGY